MAREIDPASEPMFARDPGEPRRVKRQVKKAPGWYHGAVPVMYTLGSILILIGLWAVGALIYMAVKTPAEPGDVVYPLISWAFNPDGDGGAYTAGSKMMAMASRLETWLACLSQKELPQSK